MAKVALRTSWLGGSVTRTASLLVIAGLVLGFTVMAEAQDPQPTKPKVVVIKPGDKDKKEEPKAEPGKITVVKPGDKKPVDEPKKTEPKTEPKPEPTTPPDTATTTPGKLTGFVTKEEPTRLIDEYLSTAWKENQITSSGRCDDYEFIRRASLDIIGRIATVPEIERFMKDPPASRRGQLLERLLYGEGKENYARNFATIWTNWLMTRSGTRLYHEQIHLWLEEAFSTETLDAATGKVVPKAHMPYKEMVERLITATGKSNDNGAVNYILAHLGAASPAGRQAQEGAFDVVPITARTVRLFLGYQIQCTQCHDHPFNADWKQKHFWGVNVFFRQIDREGTLPGRNNNMMMQNPVLNLKDNTGFNAKGIVFYEKRNGVFLPSEPIFLDGRRIPQNAQGNRREELSRFITSHKNFDRAIVNRMFGHLFGRGVNVKPGYDDFGEHNEVVHDELLTKLGESFARSGAYDPRKLIQWLCSSDAYNLKPVANSTNASAELEPYFSRMQLKMMSPEQLLESLLTATQPAGTADRDANKQLRERWMGVLVRNFGDDEGNEVSYNGTILQALLMMNGQDLNRAVSAGSGTVKDAMAKVRDPRQVINYLFLATLNRPVSTKEYTAIMAKLPRNEGETALHDVFWALLNCNEFILNH